MFSAGQVGWGQVRAIVGAAKHLSRDDRASSTPASPRPSTPIRALAGLVGVCADWLGGGPGRPAKPLYVVHVDAADASVNVAGIVEVNVRGALPAITKKLLATAAQHADVKLVVTDGARPLATSKKVSAADVPADTAFVVKARDKGCRFPGSPDPARHTHTHHRTKPAPHPPFGLRLATHASRIAI